MRKQHILQAAVHLFAHQGYAATGIRDIGAACGLNSATLYHHMGGGKEEILATIMRHCLQTLLRDTTAAIARSEDPVVQLIMLVSAHVGFSALNPLTTFVTDQEMRALSPQHYTALLALRDDFESLYASVLDRGIHTQRFVLEDMRIARLALLEMCNGVAHWFRPDGRLSVTQVQEHFIRFACRVVVCPPPDAQHFATYPMMLPIRLDIEPAPDRFSQIKEGNFA